MEALGVAASIIGLVSAAGKIIAVVAPILSSVHDAARIAAPVHAEAVNCRIVLAALQRLVESLDKASTVSRRAALVQVDDFISVLMDGVLLFSELEALLLSFGPCEDGKPIPYRVRVKWVQNEKMVGTMLARLQGFKSTTSLILNIFQWYGQCRCSQLLYIRLTVVFSDSDIKAAESQQSLESSVTTLLERNQDLAQRLGRLESCVDTESVLGRKRPLEGWDEKTVDLTTIPESDVATRFDFEADLAESRPYRQIKRDSIDRYSRRISVARSTAAWSIFSEISLSAVSAISILALPLYSSDLANPQHYAFGNIQPAPSRLKDTKTPRLVWKGPASETDFGSPTLTLIATITIFDKYIPMAGISLAAEQKSRGKTLGKLRALSPMQLNALCIDIIDELSRRSMEAMGCELVPQFLKPVDSFHPERNQARWKLNTLGIPRLSDLVSDVYLEVKRRRKQQITEGPAFI